MDLLEAAKVYFAAMDELADTPVTRLSAEDPRFAAVAETRARLRAAAGLPPRDYTKGRA